MRDRCGECSSSIVEGIVRIRRCKQHEDNKSAEVLLCSGPSCDMVDSGCGKSRSVRLAGKAQKRQALVLGNYHTTSAHGRLASRPVVRCSPATWFCFLPPLRLHDQAFPETFPQWQARAFKPPSVRPIDYEENLDTASRLGKHGQKPPYRSLKVNIFFECVAPSAFVQPIDDDPNLAVFCESGKYGGKKVVHRLHESIWVVVVPSWAVDHRFEGMSFVTEIWLRIKLF